MVIIVAANAVEMRERRVRERSSRKTSDDSTYVCMREQRGFVGEQCLVGDRRPKAVMNLESRKPASTWPWLSLVPCTVLY
jgi:hypothetical protein